MSKPTMKITTVEQTTTRRVEEINIMDLIARYQRQGWEVEPLDVWGHDHGTVFQATHPQLTGTTHRLTIEEQ